MGRAMRYENRCLKSGQEWEVEEEVEEFGRLLAFQMTENVCGLLTDCGLSTAVVGRSQTFM